MFQKKLFAIVISPFLKWVGNRTCVYCVLELIRLVKIEIQNSMHSKWEQLECILDKIAVISVAECCHIDVVHSVASENLITAKVHSLEKMVLKTCSQFLLPVYACNQRNVLWCGTVHLSVCFFKTICPQIFLPKLDKLR